LTRVAVEHTALSITTLFHTQRSKSIRKTCIRIGNKDVLEGQLLEEIRTEKSKENKN